MALRVMMIITCMMLHIIGIIPWIILGDSDNYNDNEFNSYISGKVLNSIKSKKSGIINRSEILK